MKSPTIQRIIHPGMPLAALLVVLYLGSWVLNFYHLRDFHDFSAAEIRLFEPSKLKLILSVFLITALNLLMIVFLNNKYFIIRVRSFLPVFLYAFFITAWEESHFLISSHLFLTVFLICLMLFLGMYKNRKAVLPAFWGSLLISLISIFNPVYLFLMPVVWIGFAQLKSFSTRVFLASFMGMLVPWIFYLSYQLYAGNEILIFNTLFEEFQPGFLLTDLSLHKRIYIGFLFLIFIISLVGIYTNLLNDSAQTRKNINFFVLILVFLIPLIVIFPRHTLAFLPLVAFFLSMLLAHPFTLNYSRFFTLLFFVFCAVNAAYMYFNYFIF
ncbi:MAG: hypothetical protein PHQ11_03660 [Paludibacter sp.]|nr:hypothetical protein [Paludibacter sp.]